MYNYFKLFYKSLTEKKIAYSYGGIDNLINYIFKEKKNGFYVDIGCGHPIKNNNTYLLHKKGWHGINVDLSSKSIELFNYARKDEYNVNMAVSDKKGLADLFYYHNMSPINTIDKEASDYQKAKVSKVIKISTDTLNSLIENSPFNNQQIDFMSVDVEGSELNVLKNFNFLNYSPKILVVEYLDLTLSKLEIKNLNIENILKSEIYKLITSNNYTLERLDTNDFPKSKNTKPNLWTQKVMN